MTNAEIEGVDLKTLTIEEIQKVNNPVLRAALIAAKQQVQEDMTATHTKHEQHVEHSNLNR